MYLVLRFVTALILVASVPLDAAIADKRVALVVGNSAYKHAGRLANPGKDAFDVAVALRRKGFVVIEGMDLNKVTFVSKVQEFERSAAGAEIALFFYAGHGVQISGQNYLVPSDAKLETAAAVATELLAASLIYRATSGRARFSIVVLDACRDNPLSEQLKTAMGERSSAVGRGLAREDTTPSGDFLVSFSTQPGNVALNGEGRNSPFAAALVKHLTPVDPNSDLAGILQTVRLDVAKATRQKQHPWDVSSLRMPLKGLVQRRPQHKGRRSLCRKAYGPRATRTAHHRALAKQSTSTSSPGRSRKIDRTLSYRS